YTTASQVPHTTASQVPPPANSQSINASLLTAGFSLIGNNCNDFFRDEGRRQQRLAFFKDTSTALSSLATGALGAAGVAGNAVAIVSLLSVGSNATINIVAQDFLFGADNIDDVRTLGCGLIEANS
ncbi:MAG: hypothetical protein ACRECN_06335, partial [Methylocella sp.]